MVARPGTYVASNNSGELKPELHGRTDLKQFYGGLAYALNVEPVPQGGSRLSPRTRHLSRVRSRLTPIVPDGSFENFTGITGPATLVQINFIASKRVAVGWVGSLTASQQLGAILQIQYFDGTWKPLGPAFSAGPMARTRTGCCPPGAPAMATAVRLQVISAPPSATNFTISTLQAMAETTERSLSKLSPFTFAIDQTYIAVNLDLFIDFYRDGVWVGGAHTGLAMVQLQALSVQQRFDTMLQFHEDAPSLRIMRDGSDAAWPVDRLPFENIPQVDLGGSYNNATIDKWDIYLRFPTTGAYANGEGIGVAFTINGEATTVIQVPGGPDWGVFCAQAKAAIENLASVEPGISVFLFGSYDGGVSLSLQFTGTDNIGNANTVAAQVVNTIEAAATVAHIEFGRPGGELLISASAGWPACGQFYQDRLITGGFRSKRGALMASVTGDYFNNNTDLVAASGAILNNLDTDGAERIIAIARSRHLVIFTTDGEYFISDRSLSKTVTPTIVNSSRNGSAIGVGVVENEGALIYVSRNNALIYAATYDDVAAAYVSAPISLLASHIASDVAAQAIQRASTATDAARLWLVRNDGTMTLGTMLRGESITAFTRWHTDGAVRGVAVDGKNVAHLLVERAIAGGALELHLERLELGLIFDGTIEQTFETPRTHIDGLGAHEAAEVWAQADGYVVGPFTVSSGAIDIPDAATHVLVGRWTAPIADTLPLPSEITERVVLRRPKRVHTARLDLVDTTSVAVGANGLPARDVALARAGDPLDAPLAPVNRTVPVTGLRGFSDEGKVRITQTRPGQLAWRGITIEART